MSYIDCLIAAGADVKESKYVGDYQGSWGAIAEYEGKLCLITGSYGSCSGCDAFQAEFDYSSEPTAHDGKFYRSDSIWDRESECTEDEYKEALSAYKQRLSDFAQSYLKSPMFKEDIERQLASYKIDDYFDSEEKELYEWAITFFN